MALTKTPICDFGKKAENFKLKSISGKSVSLEDIKGKNGTLIMFICNHCPYVKAIIKDLVEDCKKLKLEGINSVAIMSNDTKNYPEDSFDKMIEFAKDNEFGDLNYLIDETQEVAKKYEAVCTPDFFGYNHEGKLNYRGRISEMNNLQFVNEKNELLEAMIMISIKNKGPEIQYPSAGCSIKWKN